MRVVVTGATGNLGSASVRSLAAAGHDVVGLARRSPAETHDGAGSVSWVEADVASDDLGPAMEGADAVVHLAWRFQPTRSPSTTWEANAVGTSRVLAAAAGSGVSTLVCASSVAAYSPARPGQVVDEDWPTNGASDAAYCREKAYVERLLDHFSLAHEGVRVARLRPAFVFQRSAASEQRRIFGGPLAVRPLFRRGAVPFLPVPAGLSFQAIHAADVAQAVVAAVEHSVTGAFNLAGEGVVDRSALSAVFGARPVEVPSRVVRGALAAGFRARLAPVPPELFDALVRLPTMDTCRARDELGWVPSHSARDAVDALRDGAARGAGSGMPPLHP